MKTICPHCKQEYTEIPDEYLGITLQCSVCQKEFVCQNVTPAFVQVQYRTVPPPHDNQHLRYNTAAEESYKPPVKYLLGKFAKYAFMAFCVIGLVYAIWYNLPGNKQKRAEKEVELRRIRNIYMVNYGETEEFRAEVKRLHDKFEYEKFGSNATQRDCVESVKKIVNNWNAAVSGFKNADKKQFTDIDSILILYAMMGRNAYHVSRDFDLPARLLLIQKSQAEAAEIGKKIYEAVEDGDIEEKEKLLKEYDRLINLGNLNK